MYVYVKYMKDVGNIAYYVRMFEKNTPRDFFLHAGAFITLYLGAIALITLLFSVINYSIPDPLAGAYYSDPYSGPMRFAIASLLVLAPISVYLFFLIQGAARQTPERLSLGVRKWLTYITLFIAGATVVGDIIVLLNSFLGGSLPTAFLLKIATILLVMGAGFGYFILDIRGYWLSHADNSRYVGVGLLGFVLASIVGGMTLIGSPMTQRDYRIDNQQVQDLSMISYQVLSYWQTSKMLPEDLAALDNPLSQFTLPTAPEGQPAYIYKKTGDLSFELCATFRRESPQEGSYTSYQSGFVEGEKWNHGIGETCFTRTIDPKMFTPQINISPKTLEVPVDMQQ